MTLSISILGPLVIESGDCRLGKVPKKARALLAFLAAQAGQPVTRERLADLLWPYQGSEQARHSLRNCLLELRKALGRGTDAHLAADFANCRIQDAIVDLVQFERLSRSQHRCDLQAAADLYRGELLADFDINSEPFQEWLAAERDRTLAMVCDILHRLSAKQDAAGEHEAAIQSGRRLVFLDPLSEFGQRALIRAYAHAGRRGEALRQYRSCAETLKRELGVAPDVETQSLANEISRSSTAREHNLPELPGRRARSHCARQHIGSFARASRPDAGGCSEPRHGNTALALSVAEHCRSRCTSAQPDRRSRPTIFGGSLYRRPRHRPASARTRALAEAVGRRSWSPGQRQPDIRTRL